MKLKSDAPTRANQLIVGAAILVFSIKVREEGLSVCGGRSVGWIWQDWNCSDRALAELALYNA